MGIFRLGKGNALRPYMWVGFALLASLTICSGARGDVGVVLNDSLDTSVARITGSGHSAVYLSRICPASPVQLRLCRPGEEGSVISNYTTLGEDQPFEWNIVPLNMFLYGVADPKDRPLFASWPVKRLLEESYREKVLSQYCITHSCETSGKAEWREMVGATAERTLYILVASTTVEQDLDLIAKFNSMPNVNHFNAMRRNCADFTKDIIDTYFPHAAHRDVLNDFGITSPKAVARSFAHYAHRNPEIEYHVLHFAQLPGTIKRSSECRNGTEQLYRSKKLVVPAGVLSYPQLPLSAAGLYLLTGEFSPQREFEWHATERETELGDNLKVAEGDDEARAKELKAEEVQERTQVLGSANEWKAFREKFDSLADDAAQAGIIASRSSLDHVFKKMTQHGTASLDDRGGLWMRVDNSDGTSSVVGLSASNVLAAGSDRKLAYTILLANVNEVLRSSARRRETMPEFKQTWALLEQARPQTQTYIAQRSGTAH
jgi:hypothetical protein